MLKISSITAYPSQKFFFEYGGFKAQVTLTYRPSIRAWYMDITWNNFLCYGRKLCIGVNILDQYSNVIPFGILITTNTGLDPYLINDFSTGVANFYVLETIDLQSIDTYYKAK